MTENKSRPLSFESPEQENDRLREENSRLRRLLTVHGIPIPQPAPEQQGPHTAEAEPPVDKEERARKRIALFRSLFRGREDVYARRWENPKGDSGYSPADIKDWKAINKSRPEDRKKVHQQTRKFLPVTDAVIESHLLGKETVGVYPLLPDETCWFLAADFDKKTWEYDSLAFLETCQALGVPAALERSRSGKGGHIWIFFDRARAGNHGAQAGLCDSDANHGTQTPARSRFVRPILPQSGHDAEGRVWKSHRTAPAAHAPQSRKQCIHRWQLPTVPRPVAIPLGGGANGG